MNFRFVFSFLFLLDFELRLSLSFDPVVPVADVFLASCLLNLIHHLVAKLDVLPDDGEAVAVYVVDEIPHVLGSVRLVEECVEG